MNDSPLEDTDLVQDLIALCDKDGTNTMLSLSHMKTTLDSAIGCVNVPISFTR